MEENNQFAEIELKKLINLSVYGIDMPSEAVNQLPLICTSNELNKEIKVSRQWLENAIRKMEEIKEVREKEKQVKGF